jgi:hypothetical protein
MEQLRMRRFERDTNCAVTVTVQFYFVVEQGRPISENDIRRAVDICEEAYKGCSWDGNLMESSAAVAFAKTPVNASVFSLPPSLSAFPTPVVSDPTVGFPGGGDLVQRSPNPNEAALAPGTRLVGTSVDTLQAPAASLFGASYDALAHIGDLAAAVRNLPVSHEGYSWLQGTAIARLAKQSDLDVAFHLFRLANDLHVQFRGYQCSTCLYNMACCQSLAVALMVQRYRAVHPAVVSLAACTQSPAQVGGLVAPAMPPCEGAQQSQSTASVCEARLDAAASWLAMAIVAGWRTQNQRTHTTTDPDLGALRELALPRFEGAMRLMQFGSLA